MLWSAWPVYERVLVNLHDGAAIRGILVKRRGPLLVLTSAELLEPGQPPAGMDGEVYIERTQVSFVQAMPAKGG